MRAAVLRRFGDPLELTDVAQPSPARGEVLVRVRAVGLCGTDLKVLSGTLQGLVLPLIPGHEVAGELVAGGDARLHGTRVACYLYEPCDRCRWCRAGTHALCPTAGRVGRNRDGGLAEYVLLRQENVFPFQDLDFASAAVAMDAVATPWRALRARAKLVRGELVAIAGAGGLGLNALQIARDLEATAAVIDPNPVARSRALELGAVLAVAPSGSADLSKLGGRGIDVGLEASGTLEGFEALVRCVRPGGRVVCCGYAPGAAYALESMRLVLSELTVLGSRAASREDARDALLAVQHGTIAPTIARQLPFEQVNEAVALLQRGGTAGRIVVQVP